MAGDSYFLKLDSISGDSTHRDHPGEIELLGFERGVTNVPVNPTGGSSGRAVPGQFVATMITSKAAPLLLLATTSGRHLRSAVLSAVSGGPRSRAQFEMVLEDVQVNGYQVHGATDDGRTVDQVRLSFAKITHTFHPQDAGGGAAPAVTSSWNFKTNSPT